MKYLVEYDSNSKNNLIYSKKEIELLYEKIKRKKKKFKEIIETLNRTNIGFIFLEEVIEVGEEIELIGEYTKTDLMIGVLIGNTSEEYYIRFYLYYSVPNKPYTDVGDTEISKFFPTMPSLIKFFTTVDYDNYYDGSDSSKTTAELLSSNMYTKDWISYWTEKIKNNPSIYSIMKKHKVDTSHFDVILKHVKVADEFGMFDLNK